MRWRLAGFSEGENFPETKKYTRLPEDAKMPRLSAGSRGKRGISFGFREY